jgi:hypothetical protein
LNFGASWGDERYPDGGTYSLTFNVSGTTDINELTTGKEWLVYHNPARETVTVAMANLLPQTTLTIYSRTGQAIYTTVLDNTSNDISLNGHSDAKRGISLLISFLTITLVGVTVIIALCPIFGVSP